MPSCCVVCGCDSIQDARPTLPNTLLLCGLFNPYLLRNVFFIYWFRIHTVYTILMFLFFKCCFYIRNNNRRQIRTCDLDLSVAVRVSPPRIHESPLRLTGLLHDYTEQRLVIGLRLTGLLHDYTEQRLVIGLPLVTSRAPKWFHLSKCTLAWLSYVETDRLTTAKVAVSSSPPSQTW